MEVVLEVYNAVLFLFRLPLDIFGYNLSLWQVFIYTAVACIVLGFIMEVFSGG